MAAKAVLSCLSYCSDVRPRQPRSHTDKSVRAVGGSFRHACKTSLETQMDESEISEEQNGASGGELRALEGSFEVRYC